METPPAVDDTVQLRPGNLRESPVQGDGHQALLAIT
jgi:hypothetical protein